MSTDVFAPVGKRTTGTGAGSFVIMPSGWRGEISEGLQRIDARQRPSSGSARFSIRAILGARAFARDRAFCYKLSND